MTKPTSERALQNFVKDLIKSEGGYYTQLHPGIGSDTGIPDLIVGTDAVNFLPVELKIGTIENQTMVWSSSVRPTQIAWHTRTTSHGYPSSILIGVPTNGTWRLFIVHGALASSCKDGLYINKTTKEIDTRYFTTEIDSWADETFNTYIND